MGGLHRIQFGPATGIVTLSAPQSHSRLASISFRNLCMLLCAKIARGSRFSKDAFGKWICVLGEIPLPSDLFTDSGT